MDTPSIAARLSFSLSLQLPREISMTWCSLFMNHVGGGFDPHDCWQSDGFWPDRVRAQLDDLHVWGCGLSLSYCGSGNLVQYLGYTSGRMLPEMLLGFAVLGCNHCADITTSIILTFGDHFPRDDRQRNNFVYRHENAFNAFDVPLWNAWASDDFDHKAEQYYETYCTRHGVSPSTV